MKTYEKHEFGVNNPLYAPEPKIAALEAPDEFIAPTDPMEVLRQIADQRNADPPPKPDSVTMRRSIDNGGVKTFEPYPPPAGT